MFRRRKTEKAAQGHHVRASDLDEAGKGAALR